MQTEDYARAAISADSRLGADVVEQRVKFRLERQRTHAELTIILSEGALRLVAGSPRSWRHRSSISVRPPPRCWCCRSAAGTYPLRGSFALLDFDASDEDPSIAYIDGPPAARYLDQPDERAEYEFVWGVIEDMSIPIEEWQ